jgi:hypothetical protein
MANDPGIQGELKAIEQEFAVTEMDGLTESWAGLKGFIDRL